LSISKFATNKYRQVSLYNKFIINLIDNNQIQDVSYDIFETRIYNRFTFVRCMNILNLVYFCEEKLYKGLENVVLSLKENGILQIGRTVSSRNNVSFYRLQHGELIHLYDINDGTEIKEIIIKYNNKQCTDSITRW